MLFKIMVFSVLAFSFGYMLFNAFLILQGFRIRHKITQLLPDIHKGSKNSFWGQHNGCPFNVKKNVFSYAFGIDCHEDIRLSFSRSSRYLRLLMKLGLTRKFPESNNEFWRQWYTLYYDKSYTQEYLSDKNVLDALSELHDLGFKGVEIQKQMIQLDLSSPNCVKVLAENLSRTIDLLHTLIEHLPGRAYQAKGYEKYTEAISYYFLLFLTLIITQLGLKVFEPSLKLYPIFDDLEKCNSTTIFLHLDKFIIPGLLIYPFYVIISILLFSRRYKTKSSVMLFLIVQLIILSFCSFFWTPYLNSAFDQGEAVTYKFDEYRIIDDDPIDGLIGVGIPYWNDQTIGAYFDLEVGMFEPFIQDSTVPVEIRVKPGLFGIEWIEEKRLLLDDIVQQKVLQSGSR